MFERGDVQASVAYGGTELEVCIQANGCGSQTAFIPRNLIDQLFEAWAKQQAKDKEGP
jgi:hypothetical protein